jgi:peptidyl-prolyl cis-trans isomerase C
VDLRINQSSVPSTNIAREAALHAQSGDPDAAARRSLAVRELLLQRAGVLGLLEDARPREQVVFASRDEEDRIIGQVLDREVVPSSPTLAECRCFYDAHPERFTSGDLVEARHILFAVTSGTPVPALRAQAEKVLQELLNDPDQFAERARTMSNCPSGEQGGSLGQFGRGAMVPEFDRAVFETQATGVLPGLVATRYGFHIIGIERRIPGRLLPFEGVQSHIADYLAARQQERALRDYVRGLAQRATLEGVTFFDLSEPLEQPA